MAVKTESSTDISDWIHERITHLSTEMISCARYIDQPSSSLNLLNDMTMRFICAPMLVCRLEAISANGERYEAFALNALDTDLESTTPTLRDPDLTSVPQDLLDRLSYLAALPENWYMRGAKRIGPRAIEKTVHLLLQILRLGGKNFASPFIAPSPDGGLALRWNTQIGTELHMEIAPDGRQVEYLFVRTVGGQDVEELEGQLDETDVGLSLLLGRV